VARSHGPDRGAAEGGVEAGGVEPAGAAEWDVGRDVRGVRLREGRGKGENFYGVNLCGDACLWDRVNWGELVWRQMFLDPGSSIALLESGGGLCSGRKAKGTVKRKQGRYSEFENLESVSLG
jgi:hypothetical protein